MGNHIIQENFENKMELAKTEIFSHLKKSIRPEFLNRIDDVILFTPLSKNSIKTIVSLQLDSIKKMLTIKDIILDATQEAIDYLAKVSYQPEFGARPIKRVIQKEVLNELSKQILSGKIISDSIILLDCFDDKLVFRNQSDLKIKS